MDIFKLIKYAEKQEATDITLVVDNPPFIRTFGAFRPVESWPILTGHDVFDALSQISTEAERQDFKDSKELDFAYTVEGITRLRCNVALQLNGLSLAIRLLPLKIPTIDGLELPQVFKTLITGPLGLIVVSGPTDSGKTTTLAAMVEHLNTLGGYNILTIEDPIEYIFACKKSVITQRQLGKHTTSFPKALKHALRQNPDIVLVGEIRDAATAAAVITLAESGHVVLTTSHAPSAHHAIERIIDMFPPENRNYAQTRLASLLIAVICQRLVPRAKSKGRIAAVEIMIANDAVRTIIREGRIHQLPNVLIGHHDEGMISMEDSLKSLYKASIIDKEVCDLYLQVHETHKRQWQEVNPDYKQKLRVN